MKTEMNTLKAYTAPEMEIVVFDAKDVIATSEPTLETPTLLDDVF
jgi:hypothetical protein